MILSERRDEVLLELGNGGLELLGLPPAVERPVGIRAEREERSSLHQQ